MLIPWMARVTALWLSKTNNNMVLRATNSKTSSAMVRSIRLTMILYITAFLEMMISSTVSICKKFNTKTVPATVAMSLVVEERWAVNTLTMVETAFTSAISITIFLRAKVGSKSCRHCQYMKACSRTEKSMVKVFLKYKIIRLPVSSMTKPLRARWKILLIQKRKRQVCLIWRIMSNNMISRIWSVSERQTFDLRAWHKNNPNLSKVNHFINTILQ